MAEATVVTHVTDPTIDDRIIKYMGFDQPVYVPLDGSRICDYIIVSLPIMAVDFNGTNTNCVIFEDKNDMLYMLPIKYHKDDIILVQQISDDYDDDDEDYGEPESDIVKNLVPMFRKMNLVYDPGDLF